MDWILIMNDKILCLYYWYFMKLHTVFFILVSFNRSHGVKCRSAVFAFKRQQVLKWVACLGGMGMVKDWNEYPLRYSRPKGMKWLATEISRPKSVGSFKYFVGLRLCRTYHIACVKSNSSVSDVVVINPDAAWCGNYLTVLSLRHQYRMPELQSLLSEGICMHVEGWSVVLQCSVMTLFPSLFVAGGHSLCDWVVPLS